MAGAEILVRNSTRLAELVGVSPLMIGLTVVALGTSSPELAIALRSALDGVGDMALGNVVGSNIINILLILGVAAMIRPVRVSEQLIRLDVPVMFAASLITFFLASDGRISRSDGALLTFLGVVYSFLLFRAARKDHRAMKELVELDPAGPDDGDRMLHGQLGLWLSRWLDPGRTLFRVALPVLRISLIALGIALLVVGANIMVDAALDIADRRGLSPLVVGLTVLALGTSLPELATSVTSSWKGQSDIAAGNVVGSNLLNLLLVLGLTAAIVPGGLPVPTPALAVDLPVMLAVTLATFPIFFTGHIISRSEGALFLFYYLAYTVYLVLKGTRETETLETMLEVSMIYFVLPLTVITLILVTVRERQKAHRRARSQIST
jgi:cation:H+ antiporter